MSRPTTKEPSFIDPARLYAHKGMINDCGISPNRIREARRAGHQSPALKCGRRIFYRGHDVIEFIEKLSAAGL